MNITPTTAQNQQNRIVALNTKCDPKASSVNALWSIDSEFECNNGSLWLMSRDNDSFYSHSRPDIPRNTAAELFDCSHIKVTPIDNAKIVVTGWKFGKQSDKRHSAPKNEGCLYVTVHTGGVIINKMKHLETMTFKLFATGQKNEDAALDVIKSVASQKLIDAINTYLLAKNTPH